MGESMRSHRWGRAVNRAEFERLKPTEVHARLRWVDQWALCEEGGTSSLVLRAGTVALNLDQPGAEAARHLVTCVGCLEWMHA